MDSKVGNTEARLEETTGVGDSRDLFARIDRLANRMTRSYSYDAPRLMEGLVAHLYALAGGRFPLSEAWLNDPASDPKRFKVYSEEVLQIMAEQPAFTDVLGPLYMAIAGKFKRSGLGQFFTPQPLARMMAAMTLGPPSAERPRTVQEPACGSGVLLLANAQHYFQTYGPASVSKLAFYGIDRDPICVAMTGVQLLWQCQLHDAPLASVVLFQGDTLDDLSKAKLWMHATARPEGDLPEARMPETPPPPMQPRLPGF